MRRDWLCSVLAGFVVLAGNAWGQGSFEQPPIDYLKAPPDDPIVRLQKKIDAGEVKLAFEDGPHGYLKSVLELLKVPVSSQALVYSKTSFQLRQIAPRTPRAVYFGDDMYVGCVQGGDVLEISAVDPHLGANFYTLRQLPDERPRFQRHTHECLQCHGGSLTRSVPGHTVRSVFPAPDGHPVLSAGTYLTDSTSPLKERWGGWYVTGTHGGQRHMGNQLVRNADDPRNLDLDRGANVTDLSPYFATRAYLTPHSDIVALMVLEHQATMQNVITQANFLTRYAQRDAQVMNQMLGRPADYESESTTHRVRSAAEPVVKHLLFVGETVLTEPVAGTSGFSDEFAGRGPRDKRGRSLREFDLQTRMFKYPCSYLIYSEQFDALPPLVKDRVYQRLWEVLTGKDTSADFKHLTDADKRAILEILRETKPNLPKNWAT